MLDRAADGGFAVPAVNVTSSQTLNAAMRGFADAGSDGIVQVTVGGAAYFGGGAAVAGARALAATAHELAQRHDVAIALHTDHCPPEHVDDFLRPLLKITRERRARGQGPLFHSHMFDGSALELGENLRIAVDLLAECHELAVVLEVECGVVGGEEDGIRGDAARSERLYTTTDDLMRVARELGTGERGRYLLAATFGNVHGLYATGHVQLRPEILGDGQQELAAAYRIDPPPRFDYVFHGSSGATASELAAAVLFGVVKVNLDTETQYAFTRAVAGHMFSHYDGVLHVDGGLGDKRAFDPRSWGAAAEASMAARVAEACSTLGSAGRSVLR